MKKAQSVESHPKTTIADFFSQAKKESHDAPAKEETRPKPASVESESEILIDSSDNDDIVSTIKHNATSLMVERPWDPEQLAAKDKEAETPENEEDVSFQGQKKRVSIIDSDEESSPSIISLVSSEESGSSEVVSDGSDQASNDKVGNSNEDNDSVHCISSSHSDSSSEDDDQLRTLLEENLNYEPVQHDSRSAEASSIDGVADASSIDEVMEVNSPVKDVDVSSPNPVLDDVNNTRFSPNDVNNYSNNDVNNYFGNDVNNYSNNDVNNYSNNDMHTHTNNPPIDEIIDTDSSIDRLPPLPLSHLVPNTKPTRNWDESSSTLSMMDDRELVELAHQKLPYFRTVRELKAHGCLFRSASIVPSQVAFDKMFKTTTRTRSPSSTSSTKPRTEKPK